MHMEHGWSGQQHGSLHTLTSSFVDLASCDQHKVTNGDLRKVIVVLHKVRESDDSHLVFSSFHNVLDLAFEFSHHFATIWHVAFLLHMPANFLQ